MKESTVFLNYKHVHLHLCDLKATFEIHIAKYK